MAAHLRASLRAILLVARKELLTSLRDRQTVIYTLVLPVCMYPILFWGMVQVALVVQGKREHTEVRVGLIVEQAGVERSHVRTILESPRAPSSSQQGAAALGRLEVVELSGPEDARARTFLARADAGPAREEAGATGAPSGAESGLDALLVLAAPQGAPERAVLHHDSTNGRSQIARRRVGERLPRLAQELRAERARDLGIDPVELEPLDLRSHDLAPERDRGALMLSVVLPMLLVFMCFLGAFFPAVDSTAGEKERGCAETTLLLPVPRSAVHQGKILAVGTTATVATALNLVAIGLSARHLLAALGPLAHVEMRFPLGALLAILPFALLFAFFVSALLTSLATLANTFKEGQALLGPAQMVLILPAMAGVLPGLELTPAMAFVPVLDVVLAFKSILLGKPLYLEYGLTALALAAYASAAIAFAMRMLSRESLWVSAKGLPLSRVLRVWRSRAGVR